MRIDQIHYPSLGKYLPANIFWKALGNVVNYFNEYLEGTCK
jgi:hypothetical protein